MPAAEEQQKLVALFLSTWSETTQDPVGDDVSVRRFKIMASATPALPPDLKPPPARAPPRLPPIRVAPLAVHHGQAALRPEAPGHSVGTALSAAQKGEEAQRLGISQEHLPNGGQSTKTYNSKTTNYTSFARAGRCVQSAPLAPTEWTERARAT